MTTHTQIAAEDVLKTLTRVVDPAWGVNIVDLGFVYGIETDHGKILISMTLPTADYAGRDALLESIDRAVRDRHAGAPTVDVDLVWDPPWRRDFISPDGELQLEAPIPIDDVALNAPLTEESIEDSLRLVIDPELGINIVDLGLIYGISVDGGRVDVTMTLTTPGCPLQATIEAAIERVLETRHRQVEDIGIELVWDPPWGTDLISDEGRAQLASRR